MGISLQAVSYPASEENMPSILFVLDVVHKSQENAEPAGAFWTETYVQLLGDAKLGAVGRATGEKAC